jgi:hypothetical protein
MTSSSLSVRPRLIGGLAAFVVVVGVLAQAGGATGAIADASVTVTPDHGPPVTRTVVNGTGFGATEQVLITFDAKQVGTAITDGAGSFSTAIGVPRSAKPGYHAVTATGQSSGLSAIAPFQIRTNWRSFRRDRANTAFNPYENVLKPSNVHRLRVAWSFHASNSISSSPSVADGVVYVGSYDHKVYALDAASGGLKWWYATGMSSALLPPWPAGSCTSVRSTVMCTPWIPRPAS